MAISYHKLNLLTIQASQPQPSSKLYEKFVVISYIYVYIIIFIYY
jgi:hypothetical protein